MGEKIRDLEKIFIGNSEFNIELNEGTKEEKYNIHIQNERVNLSFKDFNFIRFASCFLVAKKRLEIFKGEEDE
ncbi:MAG: hypothetical protein ACRC1R_08030 [Cetobacterium sp.]|uniref:hypothetical protein n=1 Tax=Cetobacterium sp. TaxID=2071632 RepID=UPI003F2EC6D8